MSNKNKRRLFIVIAFVLWAVSLFFREYTEQVLNLLYYFTFGWFLADLSLMAWPNENNA